MSPLTVYREVYSESKKIVRDAEKDNAIGAYSFELTQASGEKLIITSEEVSWQKEGETSFN